MTDTATLAVWDAIALAIAGGSNPPSALSLTRFYRDGDPGLDTPDLGPDGRILGYYLLGQDLETEAGYINQVGQQSRYTVHCWANSPTNASRLYQWLKMLLHDQRLPLVGNTMAVGIRMTKGGHVGDEDGQAFQVPATLDVETLAA